MGIVPDNIIGHSVGELGCAYVDGCFTAEQMVLSAYSRGIASIETKVIYGSMAAVGLGYEDVKDMCPPDIEVACHNSADSSTISGPAESMKEFVAKLQVRLTHIVFLVNILLNCIDNKYIDVNEYLNEFKYEISTK